MKKNFKNLKILYFETEYFMYDLTSSLLENVVNNKPIGFQDKIQALDYFKKANHLKKSLIKDKSKKLTMILQAT